MGLRRSLIIMCGFVAVISLSLTSAQIESNRTPAALNGTTGKKLFRQLLDKLFTEYNPKVAPNSDHPSDPVNISMRMFIDRLLGLDMTTQTFVATVGFQIEWLDESLTWDTHDYPYDKLIIDKKKIWRPVLALANTIKERDQIMKSALPVELTHKGLTRWYPGDTLVLDCKGDIEYFPFDVQTCYVNVEQWVGSDTMVNCTKFNIKNYEKQQPQWEVVAINAAYRTTEAREGVRYWTIDFSVTIKRRWTFYAMNIIFPIALVSMLTSIVFLLPVECGEKKNVSVTIFLTLTVFLSLIEHVLPTHSGTVCYLSLYMATQLLIGALAILVTALHVTHHHKEVEEVAEVASENVTEVDNGMIQAGLPTETTNKPSITVGKETKGTNAQKTSSQTSTGLKESSVKGSSHDLSKTPDTHRSSGNSQHQKHTAPKEGHKHEHDDDHDIGDSVDFAMGIPSTDGIHPLTNMGSSASHRTWSSHASTSVIDHDHDLPLSTHSGTPNENLNAVEGSSETNVDSINTFKTASVRATSMAKVGESASEKDLPQQASPAKPVGVTWGAVPRLTTVIKVQTGAIKWRSKANRQSMQQNAQATVGTALVQNLSFLAARFEDHCFLIFLGLNTLSILTYIIVMATGPTSEYTGNSFTND